MAENVKSFAAKITDVRTIVSALISVVVAAFTAGVIYTSLMNRVSKLEMDLEVAQKKIAVLDGENGQRKSESAGLQAALNILKSDLNGQFMRLRTDEVANYSSPIQNTDSANGAGANAVSGPGHCDAGALVAGIQPLQAGGGVSFQCAKLPLLTVK